MEILLESFIPREEGNEAVNSWLESGDFSQLFSDLELPSYQSFLDLDLIHQPPIQIFGKQCVQRRDVGFFCDDPRVSGYSYSRGVTMPSQTMPDFLRKLTQRITKQFRSNHNACLINRYRDGSDVIGAHADNETTLGTGGVISLTIYERPEAEEDRRIFRIRSNASGFCVETPEGEVSSGKNKRIWDYRIPHGWLVVMGGKFQKEFTHEIPQQKKIQYGRVSLTWRYHTS